MVTCIIIESITEDPATGKRVTLPVVPRVNELITLLRAHQVAEKVTVKSVHYHVHSDGSPERSQVEPLVVLVVELEKSAAQALRNMRNRDD